MKGEKIDLIRAINESLRVAGLPIMPIAPLLSMTAADLRAFKSEWVAPVCGKLIGSRTS